MFKIAVEQKDMAQAEVILILSSYVIAMNGLIGMLAQRDHVVQKLL